MFNFERSRRALIRFLYEHRRSTNKLVGIVSIKSFSCAKFITDPRKETMRALPPFAEGGTRGAPPPLNELFGHISIDFSLTAYIP